MGHRFFKGCYRDTDEFVAFRPGIFAGGWRETCLSDTGVCWGAFRANRG